MYHFSHDTKVSQPKHHQVRSIQEERSDTLHISGVRVRRRAIRQNHPGRRHGTDISTTVLPAACRR